MTGQLHFTSRSVKNLCIHEVFILIFLNKTTLGEMVQWHPTPVLFPGKSHGRRSLVGCSPWGCEESDTTERLHFHFSLSCIGEGNGNPLQCSCLENLRDRGAWWAAIYGVAQSWTRLKRLSSSSRIGILISQDCCKNDTRLCVITCNIQPGNWHITDTKLLVLFHFLQVYIGWDSVHCPDIKKGRKKGL